jgi:D-sedoheptulose 7-phosphate isomerase
MGKAKESIQQEIIEASSNYNALLDSIDLLEQAASKLSEIILNGGKILLAGNGGSAADACHFAAEMVGRLGRERKGIPAIALSTDPAITTSLANDYGYEHTVTRQLQSLGNKGDAFIGISTSGKSKNIIEAAKSAKELGIWVLGITGPSPRDLSLICDAIIAAPGNGTQRIQEAHALIIHILCRLIEDSIYPI